MKHRRKMLTARFIFSAYNNVNEKSNFEESVYLNWWGNFLLHQSPSKSF